MMTATEAWDILHAIQPRLFEEAQLNFRGKLEPGLTIRAEIVRKQVQAAIEFEVIRKGKIPNMATWAEIHAHFAEEDERILPFTCYIDEENRPHMDNTLLEL
jgi:hypothetical protein